MIRYNKYFISDLTVVWKALNLHKYSIARRKAPQREQSDREQIQNNKDLFDSVVEVLDTYHKQPGVVTIRSSFSCKKFAQSILLYVIFLLMLSTGKYWS